MKGKRLKPVAAPPPDETPLIRKAYFECRFGQLHVTTAFPVGGGFDEHPTLVCLHRCLLSSRVFRPFMEVIGRDRSVYAPDLPGCGESDPPPSQPSIADYAAAIADFLDHMRFRQVDLLGVHAGALIAAEVAIARPEVVRRMMFVGLPILTGDERAAWVRSIAPPAAVADDSHLNAEWLPNAALGYPAVERLPLVAQPALLVRSKDALWEASLRARPWIRDLKVLDLPAHGEDVVRAAPAVIAQHLRAFLDR